MVVDGGREHLAEVEDLLGSLRGVGGGLGRKEEEGESGKSTRRRKNTSQRENEARELTD